jgi:hypothetical protein
LALQWRDHRRRYRLSNEKEDMMKRLLTSTAVGLLMGLTPALAAENSALPAGVLQDASKQANMPRQGKPDTSGGAAEQSSASPSFKSNEVFRGDLA